ncbi:hypothetical protein B4U80_11757, partial [Leptotrombidium deliense]
MSEGEEWNIQSKFAIGHLSKLGMGKTEFEITMHNIFEETEKQIDNLNGKPHDYSVLLTEYTINVITSLLCSKSFTHEDPIFEKLERLFHTIFGVVGYGFNMHLTGNIFKYYVRLNSSDKIVTECYNELRSFAEILIQEREVTFDENNCNDLLGYWIKECKHKNSDYFDRESIIDNIILFLMAGTGTSAALLNSSLLLMAENKHVQRRVHEEIRDNVGVDGLFCYLDRERLPYTQAVLAEILRFVSTSPFGNYHVNQ